MSASQGSLRTIWITIRAMNYATRVFDDLQRDLKGMINTEELLNKQNRELLKSTMQYSVAGIMFVTLAQRMASSIFDMAAASTEGATAMAEFTANQQAMQASLANTAYELLQSTGILDFLNTVMNTIKENKALQMVVMVVIMLVSALIALAGISMFVLAINNVMHLSFLKTATSMITAKMSTDSLKVSMAGLGGAIGLAVGAFGIFYSLLNMLDGPAKTAVSAIMLVVGVLVALMAAEAGASLGITLIASAAAIAGGLALGQQLLGGSYAFGTRSIPRTGLVYAHEGEVIYNPTTNRPLQVGRDLAAASQGGGSTSITTVPITIQNLNTKSDIDDLGDEMSQALRKGMRGRK